MLFDAKEDRYRIVRIMRRYSNKELAQMSPEEGEALLKMLAEENEKLGEEIRAIIGYCSRYCVNSNGLS